VEIFKGFDFWVGKKFKLVFCCMPIILPMHFSNGVHHHALYHYTTSQKLKVHSI